MQTTVPASVSRPKMKVACLTAAGAPDTTQAYNSTGLAITLIDAYNSTHQYSASASTVEAIGNLSNPATPTTGTCGFQHIAGGICLIVFRADDAAFNIPGDINAIVTTSAGVQSPVGIQTSPVSAGGLVVMVTGTGDSLPFAGRYMEEVEAYNGKISFKQVGTGRTLRYATNGYWNFYGQTSDTYGTVSYYESASTAMLPPTGTYDPTLLTNSLTVTAVQPGMQLATLDAIAGARGQNASSPVYSSNTAGAALATAATQALQATAATQALQATSVQATSILARLGAWTGSGINTVLGAFIALFSKVASKPSDITGTMDPTTDSVEAIRDRGDAAWTGGSGTTQQITINEQNVSVK